MPVMPFLVYRYILGDLLRVILLTGAVLVTVIAFGATIKPLASDALLDARQTLKYLALAIVPMMQFALPFAAGFGATLAMHRFTADNEIFALSASGLSYRRIILPLLVLGALLSALMVGLTQWVIPHFWTLIADTVATDATRLFQASVSRGEPFDIGDMQIYADDIVVQDEPEGSGKGGGAGPQTRMLLLKVAAAELDAQGRITTHVTASQAVVDVYRREGRTYLKLVMSETVASDAGGLGRIGRVEPRPIVLASPRSDNPKAMTRDELLALRRDPDPFRQVTEAREALADSLREVEARAAIDAALRSTGQIEFAGQGAGGQSLSAGGVEAGAADAGRRYVINADRLQNDALTTNDRRRIEIIQFEGGQAVRRFITSDARLVPAGVAAGTGTPAVREVEGPRAAAVGGFTFDLILGNHEVTDLRSAGTANLRERLTVPGLTLATGNADDLARLPSAALIERARSIRGTMGAGATGTGGGAGGAGGAGDELRSRIHRLNNEIHSLQREISSRLQERYALSLTAFLLLMLGATLAMWLRGSLPLTIYLWAFLPAIVDLVLISAGEQLLRDGRPIGAYVMWSGNALLLLMWVIVFMKLSKN